MPVSEYHGPKFYVDQLTTKCGKSPYGDVLYRVALAGAIIIKKTIEWQDWDDSTDMALRGGIVTDTDTGRPVASPYKPLRTKVERREVTKYAAIEDEHFLIERWWPAHVLAPGGREDWNAQEHLVPGSGGDSIYGEFPSQGDYEMVVGPFLKPPSLSYVLDYITHREMHLEQMERDVAKRIKERVYEGSRAEQRASKQRTEENAYRIADSIRVAESSSLAAGRWRTEMAERHGYRSHIGN